MKFEYTYTRLNVANYQVCKEFYRDILGFEVIFTDDKEEYTELATGQTQITIFNRQKLGTFVNASENISYDPNYAGVVLSFQCLGF
ncbi:VOC family protein [Pleurocapsa sp. PCC 7319]|uniref:VOC family protein n=1 Tax=Pleurocapsa sp. PCC 7319 TaxID=118161 RepID=UPI00037CE3D4|nr:VOC family protein [Pleurocapsa sp. PCC 7319]